MGNICLPCNMTSEESEHYLKQFHEYYQGREPEFVSEVFNHYLFYETWGTTNMRECVCTHTECGANGHFQLYKEEDPVFFRHGHGDSIECPVCGNPVQLVSLGKMRSFATLEQTVRVTLCRTLEDGALLLTSGWATKTYSYNELRPDPVFNEKVRTVFLPGKRMQWSKFQDWNGYRYKCAGWYPEKVVKEPFSPFMYSSDGSYYLIGTENIYNSALKYSQLQYWYFDETKVDIDDQQDPVRYIHYYLSAYTEYPVIEMAVKLHMVNAVTDLVRIGRKNHQYLNWRAQNIAQFLRLPKQDAKLFIQQNTDLDTLKAFKESQKQGQVKGMAGFVKLAESAGGADNIPLLALNCKRAGCSLEQGVHYIAKHFSMNRIGYALRLWRDYLDMATTLDYDMTRLDVTMPKQLQSRHDDAAATIKVAAEDKNRKAYQPRKDMLDKLYGFELNGMCIVVPESAQDIVDEGKTLHHCVGGYAARHVNGKVDILFLRRTRKPNTPFITIEMIPRKSPTDPVTIVQIHGYKNESYCAGHVTPEDKYGWFLDVWLDWLRHGSKRTKDGKPVLPARKEKTA